MKNNTFYLFALLLLLPLVSEAVDSNRRLPPQLFSNPSSSDVPSRVDLPAQAMKGIYIRTNHQLLKLSRLSISLPNGKQVEIGRKRFITHPNGSQVWEGSVLGSQNSSIIFTRHGSTMAGVIRLGEELFKLQHVGKGIHVLVQVSPNEPAPEHEPVVADTYSYSGASSAPATDQASDDGSQIDIMVVYSTDTKVQYSGIDGVNAHIALAIAETNEAYLNSAINTQLRLVHTQEVANSSGDFSTDLNNLRLQTDGVLDEIHAKRDSYGADMVSWFIENSQYCGIAYVPTGDLSLDAGWAFSVVYSECATGYYSTAHELGHNMGSNHDRANAGSAVAYPYSYGYQEPNNAFRTVMAYNCAGGCTRQRFFSNPDLTFNGVPTGVDASLLDSADNARSINQTRVPVSQWRTAVVGSAPVAGFTADCQLVDCAFTDTTVSDDAIASWTWGFGDNSIGSNQQNPSYSYSASGTYTVSLTVVDVTGATSIVTGSVVIDDGNSQPPAMPLPPETIISANVSTSVVISWGAIDKADGYTLERQSKHPKNSKWVGSTLININSGSTTAYIDSPGGGEFRYRLQANNQFGASNWSGWAASITVTSSSSGGGGKGGGKGGKKPK